MNPVLKYALARVGIFIVCAVPALVLLPRTMNPLLKLILAVVVSAVVAYAALRRLRDEVGDHMMANANRRTEEKNRLRSALAGADDSAIDDKDQSDR